MSIVVLALGAVVVSAAVVGGGNRVAEAGRSVPEVVTDLATGSAFIVARDTLVTNAHVVSGARRVEVRFDDGASAGCQVGPADEIVDLAVLTCATFAIPAATVEGFLGRAGTSLGPAPDPASTSSAPPAPDAAETGGGADLLPALGFVALVAVVGGSIAYLARSRRATTVPAGGPRILDAASAEAAGLRATEPEGEVSLSLGPSLGIDLEASRPNDTGDGSDPHGGDDTDDVAVTLDPEPQ